MMETDRLVIRPFQKADIDDFYEYMKLESTAQYEDFTPYSYEECVALVKRRAAMDGVFAVVLKSSGKLIGDINYSEEDDGTYEIGYDFENGNPIYVNSLQYAMLKREWNNR